MFRVRVFSVFVLMFITVSAAALWVTPAYAATDCAAADVPQADCEALVALYTSTNGTSWSMQTRWLQNDTVCNWHGVNCKAGRVDGLVLNNNGLNGTLPAQIGGLTALTELYLSGNQLSGTIPTQIGQLARLERLYLSGNQLSGTIPDSIGDLSSLVLFYVDNNQLSGALPTTIDGMALVEYFHANNNQLTGSIPTQIGALTRLRGLHLNNNQLTGAIPSEIVQLTQLEYLQLQENQLSGTIPADIGQLTGLINLLLHENQLSGAIPASIERLSALQYLNLRNNQLEGALPAALGGMTNLLYFDAQHNQLSGALPDSIGNLTHLIDLYLNNNQLSGPLPASMGNLAALQYVNLRYNQLSGALPDSIGGLVSLRLFDASHNHLSGAIPPTIGNITPLTQLYLNRNQLSGSIPDSIGNLGALTHLYLNNNQLDGVIPSSIGELSALTALSLHSNRLGGAVPVEIGQLNTLTLLALQKNRLTSLPDSFVNVPAPVSVHDNALPISGINPALEAHLTASQPNWKDSQTVPPSALMMADVGSTTVSVSWMPPANAEIQNAGWYQVGYSSAGAPFAYIDVPAGGVNGKTTAAFTVTGLTPNTAYTFVVRAYTLPNADGLPETFSVESVAVNAVTDNMPVQLVGKGGFETASIAPWLLKQGLRNDKTIPATDAPTGSQVFRFAGKRTSSTLEQNVAKNKAYTNAGGVKKGDTLTLGLCVKAAMPAGSPQSVARVVIVYGNGTSELSPVLKLPLDTVGVYDCTPTLSHTIVNAEGRRITGVFVRVLHRAPNGGRLFIDNVTLIRQRDGVAPAQSPTDGGLIPLPLPPAPDVTLTPTPVIITDPIPLPTPETHDE